MLLSSLPVPSRIIAAESIYSQTDHFGERLESTIALLVDEVKFSNLANYRFPSNHPAIKQLESLIFERLKLKVTLITDESLAAVLPFYSARNHIFLPDWIHGQLNIREQTKLIKNFDERKGTVNLEKAEVGGIFSEYDHPLYLNIQALVMQHNFSAAEITGCLLHELGHAFYVCYYADRTDRTNQVLASIAKHLLSNETGDIDYVYKELSQITPAATKESVDKMLNGPRVVAGAEWFKTIVGIAKSQIQDPTYNATSFEERADNFAARFGYAKPLTLALDKLHRFGPEKSIPMMFIVQLLASGGFILLASMIFSLLATGSIGVALLAILYKMLWVNLAREDVRDYTYDKLKQRYVRIRQDAIDQLKNTKLKKDVVRGLLDSIYAVDDMVKSTIQVKTLPEVIANFIFSGARAAEKSITEQQLMEAVASNDLFINAAELRHG